MTASIAIAGLGRVGASNAPMPDANGRPTPRNHVDAALAAGLRLTGLIDPDAGHREAARQRVAAAAGSCMAALAGNIEDLPQGAADIIVLATPPQNRLEDITAVLELKPKVILVEKPCAGSSAEAQAIAAKAAANGVALYVNFNRRADPGVQAWRARWQGTAPLGVIMRYGKGLANYASHLIDHAIHWFGQPILVAANPLTGLRAGQKTGQDLSLEILRSEDRSLGFAMRFASGLTVQCAAMDALPYDMFEVDIYTDAGLFSLRNNGAERLIYDIIPDQYYPGYAGLAECVDQRRVAPIGGFREVHAALAGLCAGQPPAPWLCPFDDAALGLQVIDAVRQSYLLGGIARDPCASPAVTAQC